MHQSMASSHTTFEPLPTWLKVVLISRCLLEFAAWLFPAWLCCSELV